MSRSPLSRGPVIPIGHVPCSHGPRRGIVQPSPAHSVTVQFLGAFSIRVDGVPIERWRAGKARELFQYLLVRRGRPVPQSVLNEVLWPASGMRAQSSSLKVAVHALRQILPLPPSPVEERQDRTPSSLALLTHEVGYVLEAERVWIDFEEFEDAIDSARAAELRDDPAEALRLYRHAVELYGGDFLVGEAPTWVYERREWLRDLMLQALEWLAAAALQNEDYGSAITWSRRMLEIESYQEETYRRLILCHARLGHLGRVKSWYELCVHKLREELDVEPDRQTELLLDLALQGELTRPSTLSVPRVQAAQDAR